MLAAANRRKHRIRPRVRSRPAKTVGMDGTRARGAGPDGARAIRGLADPPVSPPGEAARAP